MNSNNLFLTTKEDNVLLLKNYIGNSKFNFNPLNKPLLLGFRNYLAIINPYFYSLYLRKAFLFIFKSSQNFAKGFFIYDNNGYKHLNKYILDIKHFSTSIFKFGFLSNFKKVMVDLNFKYKGQDKYNFARLEFPDYVFLFEENFSYNYILNECNRTTLPMVSIMNSDAAITFSSYGIISNNSGFQTSTYYTLFFIKVIKQALSLKKFDFYNNKIKIFYKNSFHFLLNIKSNSLLSTKLDSTLNQPLSLILNYISKNSINEIYFSDYNDFIKKLLIIKKKKLKSMKSALNSYLSDYNEEFYNYLKDFEYIKFFNKQFPTIEVNNKSTFDTLFGYYVTKDKEHLIEVKEFITFVVEVKNYKDLLNLDLNNPTRFKKFLKLLKYMKAFAKKHKNLPYLNALVNRKNKFNIFYFMKIARKLRYFYRRQMKKKKLEELFTKFQKYYKQHKLFDDEKYNFMARNNFYYFNKFNLSEKQRAELDATINQYSKAYDQLGIKKRFFLDKIYKDPNFKYYIRASAYHRKINKSNLNNLLTKLFKLYTANKNKIIDSVYLKLKQRHNKKSILLTEEEAALKTFVFVKRTGTIDKIKYHDRTSIPIYRIKKNFQLLKKVSLLNFLRKKLKEKRVKIVRKSSLLQKTVSRIKRIETFNNKSFLKLNTVKPISDKKAVSFVPDLSEVNKDNSLFFKPERVKVNFKSVPASRKITQLHIGNINFKGRRMHGSTKKVFVPDETRLANHYKLFYYSPSIYNSLRNVKRNFFGNANFIVRKILRKKFLNSLNKMLPKKRFLKAGKKLLYYNFAVEPELTPKVEVIKLASLGDSNKTKRVAFKARLLQASNLLNKKEREAYLYKIRNLIDKLAEPIPDKITTKLKIRLKKASEAIFKIKVLITFAKKNFGLDINSLDNVKRKYALSQITNYLRLAKIVKICNEEQKPYKKKVQYFINIKTLPKEENKNQLNRKKEKLPALSFADQLAIRYNKGFKPNTNPTTPYIKKPNPNFIHYPTPPVIKKIIKKVSKPVNQIYKKIRRILTNKELKPVITVEPDELDSFAPAYWRSFKKIYEIEKFKQPTSIIKNFNVKLIKQPILKLTNLERLINFSLARLGGDKPTKVISFNFVLTYLVKNRFISIQKFEFYKKYYFNFVTKGLKRYFVNSFKFLFNDFIVENFFNFNLNFKKIKKFYKNYYFLKPKIKRFKKNYIKIYKHFLQKLKNKIKLIKKKKSFVDNINEFIKTGKVIRENFLIENSNLTHMSDFYDLSVNTTEKIFFHNRKQAKVSQYTRYYYRYKLKLLQHYRKKYNFNKLNQFYYDKNYFYSTFVSPKVRTLQKKANRLKDSIKEMKKVPPPFFKTFRATNINNLNKVYGQRRYTTIKVHSGIYPTFHDKEVKKDPKYNHIDLTKSSELGIIKLNKVLNKNFVEKVKVKNKFLKFVNDSLQESNKKRKWLAKRFKDVEKKNKLYSKKVRELKLDSLKNLKFEKYYNKFMLIEKLNKDLFNKSKYETIVDLAKVKLEKLKKNRASKIKGKQLTKFKYFKRHLKNINFNRNNPKFFKLNNYGYFKDYKDDVYYLNFKKKSDFVGLTFHNNIIKTKFTAITNTYNEIKQIYHYYFQIFNSIKPALINNKTELPLFFNINLAFSEPTLKSTSYNLILPDYLNAVIKNFTDEVKLSTITTLIIKYITSTFLTTDQTNINLATSRFLFVDDFDEEYQSLFKNLTLSTYLPTYLSTLTAYNNKNLKQKLKFLELNIINKFDKTISLLASRYRSLTKLRFKWSYRKLKYRRYKKFKPTLFNKFHYVKNKYKRKKFKYNLIKKKIIPQKIYRY